MEGNKPKDSTGANNPADDPFADVKLPQHPEQNRVLKGIRDRDPNAPSLVSFFVIETIKWLPLLVLIFILFRVTEPLWIAIYNGVVFVVELFREILSNFL